MRLSLTASAVLPHRERRTLAGTVVRYGETGLTSAGPLRVAPGALVFPADLTQVTLTREHDRGAVRGRLALVDDSPERLYVATRVADGPEGDEALAEADRARAVAEGRPVRAAFSFDIEDAEVRDGVIVAGRVVAIGQVSDPAFNSARIDHIAASRGATTTTGRNTMRLTPEQRRRLAELTAITDRTPEQETELGELTALAVAEAAEAPADQGGDGADQGAQGGDQGQPAPQAVAASAAVPAGIPAPQRAAARTRAVSPLTQFVRDITAEINRQGRSVSSLNQVITAALTNVTQTGIANTTQQDWAGELWSGLLYEPVFTPLVSNGPLVNFKGKGWRWTTKPTMADYPGDKAPIPSAALATEDAEFTASRQAVGHDFDRSIFDFPSPEHEAYVRSYLEAVRESWEVQLDAKTEAKLIALGTANTLDTDPGVAGVQPFPAGTSVLRAVAWLLRRVQRARFGRPTFVLLSDEDFDALFDVTEQQLSAFMDLFGVKPENFTASEALAAGDVVAGVRSATTLKTVPGSPIRVEAQHIADGGIDLAAFGYYRFDDHAPKGVARVQIAQA